MSPTLSRRTMLQQSAVGFGYLALLDLLGYDLAVDYTGPPEVDLAAPLAAWADGLLRAAGLRT